MTENSLAKQGTQFADVVNAQSAPLVGYTEENRFRIHFPREGKIHLGVPTESGAPTATNYFVLPEKLLKDQPFREALQELGEDPDKPTRLPVWLPSNKIADNMDSSYNRYSKSHRLVCGSGDGITAHCRDEQTGEASEKPCLNKECPFVVSGACVVIHRLRVMLPDASGIGIWQIDTKSPNNRAALACEMTNMLGMTGGRLAGIDQLLVLAPEERLVTFNDRQGKTVQSIRPVNLLHLQSGYRLRDLKRAAAEASAVVDWDMSEVEDVTTEYDEVVMDPPTDAESADFEAGESKPPEEPTALRDELLETCTNLLQALLGTDVLRRAFTRSAMQMKGVCPTLEEASVDQLLMLKEALTAKAEATAKATPVDAAEEASLLAEAERA
jgi:hypothetical protein